MIKGDLRKKQILSTAESLFAERGYEATGIQDILDVLHLSKGSFYHHFESKEQVLQKICENRAFLAAASLNHEEHVSGEDAAVRMNTILMKMIPFHGEGLTFIKMILPVLALPEGRSVRSAYQEALKNNWLPITENALQQMIQQKKAFSLYPGKTAEIALDLINDLWARIGYEIIMAEKTNKSMISPTDLLILVQPYRAALENLFCAPYGSIELMNLESLNRTVQEIHNWWMLDSAENYCALS